MATCELSAGKILIGRCCASKNIIDSINIYTKLITDLSKKLKSYESILATLFHI